jgi:serine/threonine-protein kinase
MSDLQTRLQEILAPAYCIDRELGDAGMSRVIVATEVELDRQVVVKVLPPVCYRNPIRFTIWV